MSKAIIGTIQHMTVHEKTTEGYILEGVNGKALLPSDEVESELDNGTYIDVFVYQKDHDIIASARLPEVQLGEYGWGKITEVIPHLGAFIDIETAPEILISLDDLPVVRSVWPNAGDALYVKLKKDKKDRLYAVPARERDFNDIIKDAGHMELNDQISGHVIRAGKEGSAIFTDDGYRGFIHYSERGREPRLGEFVTGRVIEVKDDGTLNISLLPLKQERIDDDAEKIFAYLEANNGSIPFSNKSDPQLVYDTFGMSKSAFKRAIGRLLKERKIEIGDGEIIQVK